MNSNGWIRCAVVLLATSVAPCAGLSPSGWAAPPTVTTVLDLPYGSGPGEVGAVGAHEIDASSPPMCPAMFQMAQDGAIWVLDTVNARLLEFKDGHQVQAIDVSDFSKGPDYFGVTAAAVFVLKQGRRDDMPAGMMLRVDRTTGSQIVLPLDLPDGRRFLPLRVAPLGANDSRLLVYGVTWPDSSSATMVIGQDGKATSVQEDNARALSHMPGTDGSVWRLRTGGEKRENDLPGFIEKYDAQGKEWQGVPVVLPKRANLFAEREVAIVQALGVDAHGVATLMMAEGSPLSLKFVRVGPAGDVIGTFTFNDLALSQAPITSYYNAECYQVLADGSVLVQYPTIERYRILRISF